MGFDDIVNKGKELFEDAKDKVEEGFAAAKDRVDEVIHSDKAEEISDKVLDGAADAAKKIAPEGAQGTIDDVRNKVDGAIGTE